MDTLGLLRMSERLNIPVYDFKTGDRKAFCFSNAIAMDFQRVENDREGKQILAEEIHGYVRFIKDVRKT